MGVARRGTWVGRRAQRARTVGGGDDVLGAGFAPAELHRTCGISWSQIVAWRAADRTVSAVERTADSAEKDTDARVFSVIDESSDRRADNSTATFGHTLELRVGPWSVCVRLADSAQGR